MEYLQILTILWKCYEIFWKLIRVCENTDYLMTYTLAKFTNDSMEGWCFNLFDPYLKTFPSNFGFVSVFFLTQVLIVYRWCLLKLTIFHWTFFVCWTKSFLRPCFDLLHAVLLQTTKTTILGAKITVEITITFLVELLEWPYGLFCNQSSILEIATHIFKLHLTQLFRQKITRLNE